MLIKAVSTLDPYLLCVNILHQTSLYTDVNKWQDKCRKKNRLYLKRCMP